MPGGLLTERFQLGFVQLKSMPYPEPQPNAALV